MAKSIVTSKTSASELTNSISDKEIISSSNPTILIKLIQAATYKDDSSSGVNLESVEDVDGQLIISRKRAKHMRTWEKILKAETEDVIIEGKVVLKTKGGFVVDIDGIEAFLPGSKISKTNDTLGKATKFRVVYTAPSKGAVILASGDLNKEEANIQASKLNMEAVVEKFKKLKGKKEKGYEAF
jgi:small subunit ribosomal protein S1